jgi:hypothetical protein
MTGDARKRGEDAESGIQEGLTKEIARLCAIMHDWTRLCTISSFASTFAWHKADRKASTFAPADGTEDRGLAGRVHCHLAFFCHGLPFRHKKIIFFTFIELYPPLSTFIGIAAGLNAKSQSRKDTISRLNGLYRAGGGHFGAKHLARRRTDWRPGRF